MNTLEINNVMNNIECFKGTFAKDLLPKKVYKDRPIGFIINTDNSNKPGSHWVALFIDENNNAEYFDSFGIFPICCEIYKLLRINNVKKFSFNKNQIQSIFSKNCGIFCILYLKMRCNNFTLKEFINIFSDNLTLNDEIVTEIL